MIRQRSRIAFAGLMRANLVLPYLGYIGQYADPLANGKARHLTVCLRMMDEAGSMSSGLFLLPPEGMSSILRGGIVGVRSECDR